MNLKKESAMDQYFVKDWGSETLHFANASSTFKTIRVSAKQRLSLQSHEHRSETWICTKGVGTAIVDEKTIALTPGARVEIPVASIHRLCAGDLIDLEIIEISTGHYDPHDIVRIEDDYNREGTTAI